MTHTDRIIEYLQQNPGAWSANEIMEGAGINGNAQANRKYISDLVSSGKLSTSVGKRWGKDVKVYKLAPMVSDAAVALVLRCRAPNAITGARLVNEHPTQPTGPGASRVWHRPEVAPC